MMGQTFARLLISRCFGLGLSRMMGAVFQLFGYRSGILFPDKITTYDVVVMSNGMFSEIR